MDAQQALQRLCEGATTLDRLEAPPKSGVYACFLADKGASLPGVSWSPCEPIYVGVSDNLAERELGTHFAAGKSGFSTLRRSIGALLKDELDLRARPRGPGASKSNVTNYRFDDGGERRLSAWMARHLRVAVVAAPEPAHLERALIALARPALNLTGWPNPDAARIKGFRRLCADEASRHRGSAETTLNWRAEPIPTARSPSGVLLMRDYADNLIATEDAPWPPPALVAKLLADDRVAARWPVALREAVSERLGYYCPLQSINSEDAITWSFFGPLKYGSPTTRAAFLVWLLERLGIPANDTKATIDLWRRVPHPQKPSAPGPELDVLVHGDRSVVFAEAKWASSEGVGQGIAGTATQMELRRDFLEYHGRRIYGERRFIVVGVVLADPIEAVAPADTEHVVTRTIRWEELAAFTAHPAHHELDDYVAWKRRESARRP